MTRAAVALVAGVLFLAPAAAQVSVGAEAVTDERRRGLSWTGGRAAAAVDAAATLGLVNARVRATTLRGAARHAGADAVADLSAEVRRALGGLEVSGAAVAHLFAGAGTDMDYGEVGASAGYALGPARAVAGLLYAPAQSAIGGDNLYLYAGLDAGLPGTPFSVAGQIGRSSGSVDDAARAQRLRPGGAYTDWRLSLERRQGPLTLALDYTGTDIDRATAFGPFADQGHVGERLVGRIRVDF